MNEIKGIKNVSESIMNMLNDIDELADPIKTTEKHADGTIITTWVRAADHFGFNDNYKNEKEKNDAVNEYLYNQRLFRMKLVFFKTKSVLEKRIDIGKVSKERYDKYIKESAHIENDFSKMYEWVHNVAMFFDIISDSMVIEYEVIRDESNIIHGVKQKSENEVKK